MHDLEYDALQKKKIARSARNQKKGSRSRKCTMPSDYLTAAQKKKLNGEVMTYQVTKPITWAEFKKYPVDIQVQSWQHFASEHECTPGMMAEMYGVSSAAISSYACNIRPELRGILHKGANGYAKKLWKEWLAAERGEEVAPIVEEEPAEVPEEAPQARIVFNNCVKGGRIGVEGTPEEIGVALLNIFQSQRIKATISFEVVE
jgi:hypothetical protein